MQIRRVFVLNGLVNLAIFAASGGLVTAGKEQIERGVKNYNERRTTTKQEPKHTEVVLKEPVELPININYVTDFAIGGLLGIAVKKVIEKNIKLNVVNKRLSSTISKLQKLENDDLPGIERTLQEFVRSEGIRYEARQNGNLIESIQDLLNAILIHVDSQNRSVKPFLDELQKLRIAIAQPFTEQLQDDSNIDAAVREAIVQSLKGNDLIKYLETTIVNALRNSGADKIIGKNTVSSLEKKDLINDDGVTALKQAMLEVFKSPSFIEALNYSLCANVTEYDTADKLMRALLHRFKISLQDNDPDLIALKDAIGEALKNRKISS